MSERCREGKQKPLWFFSQYDRSSLSCLRYLYVHTRELIPFLLRNNNNLSNIFVITGADKGS